ncbi:MULTISPECIES: HlyD family efflux transporter periplasmic adaptor subunit [Cohnella]|uniref:HlyD family efflux transporter periplasmic adaptor subunit n=1 Tax=Cohnella TaxID=329857 RepID=UPI0009BC20F0|nr:MULTISPECIES: HlyD family efflux transporter periplasmic adaptor subunit [Cohnella]MBN2981907.1 HlyD family efflux transporter periplasmic adaptor subunit [Cohnella algarum]
MSVIVRDLKDLSDSRELLETKASPVIPVFIYILIALLAAALMWTYFGERDVVVKTAGIVRPNSQISTVKTKVTGQVASIGFDAGQRVEKGQRLMSLKADALEQQKEIYAEQIKQKEADLRQLSWFKTSVQSGKDQFPEAAHGSEIYEQFKKYLLDYEQLQNEIQKYEADVRKLQGENQYNLQVTRQQKTELTQELEEMGLLLQSVRENKNLFKSAGGVYVGQYIQYNYKIKQLEEVVSEKQNQYETSMTLGIDLVPARQIENEWKALESAKLELERYRNETITALETEIYNAEKKLADLEAVLAKKDYDSEVAKAGKRQLEAAVGKFEQDKLVEIGASIQAVEDQLRNLRDQVEQTELGVNDYVIEAPIGGIVNVVSEVNEGDLVASGTEVLTIIPENDSQFTIRLTVQNKDIADIRVGDPIKYHFPALPYKEYGELEGTITKISTDASYNQADGQSYYAVEATIENKPLYSYKGEEASIKVGMICEAYVVTESQKILYFLLEKLDLRE